MYDGCGASKSSKFATFGCEGTAFLTSVASVVALAVVVIVLGDETDIALVEVNDEEDICGLPDSELFVGEESSASSLKPPGVAICAREIVSIHSI